MNLEKSISMLMGVLLSFAILGGCGMADQNEKQVQGETNTPQPSALKDDFTKGYLTSAKEVEKGYFEFKSQTDGYTMLFPRDAVISDDFGNEKRANEFESIMYGYNLKGASISTRITYENKPSTRDIEEKLRLLSVTAGYDESFKKIHAKGKTIYYAKKTSELKNSNAYVNLSFIKAGNSNQAVEFIFNTRCKKNDQSCQSNVEDLENAALKVMTSVHFEQ